MFKDCDLHLGLPNIGNSHSNTHRALHISSDVAVYPFSRHHQYSSACGKGNSKSVRQGPKGNGHICQSCKCIAPLTMTPGEADFLHCLEVCGPSSRKKQWFVSSQSFNIDIGSRVHAMFNMTSSEDKRQTDSSLGLKLTLPILYVMFPNKPV